MFFLHGLNARSPDFRAARNERKTATSSQSVHFFDKEGHMGGIVLIVILVLALMGVLPRWSHSRNWGQGPSSGVGLALIIVVILMLLGRV